MAAVISVWGTARSDRDLYMVVEEAGASVERVSLDTDFKALLPFLKDATVIDDRFYFKVSRTYSVSGPWYILV